VRVLFRFRPSGIKFVAAITKYLPMSLATKKMAEKFEKQKKKIHGNEKKEDSEEMDLFSRNRKHEQPVSSFWVLTAQSRYSQREKAI